VLSLKTLCKFSVAVALAIGNANAAEDPAAKIDNGLGELPHFNQWKEHPALARFAGWRNSVGGEKLDSGLGELPPYSEWKNHPELAGFAIKSEASLALRTKE
jgi:hypothetical protein